MLEKYILPSVNQLGAEIKLTETWKSINVDDWPIKLNSYNSNLDENRIGLRPQQNRIFNDSYRLQIAVALLLFSFRLTAVDFFCSIAGGL